MFIVDIILLTRSAFMQQMFLMS